MNSIMRRICVILMMLCVAMAGFAQHQKKWKAPKRPKPPKWSVVKPKAPEVINVWRPYGVSDNWFFDFSGGVSASLAENASEHALKDWCQPMFNFSIGKQTSYILSTRLSLGYNKQKGWASSDVIEATPVLGDGGYKFKMAVGYVDEMVNLTNIFCRYNERRWFDVQMFVGVGVNYTWGFDEGVENWKQYGYPVDNTDNVNLALRGGLQCVLKLSPAWDIALQGAYTMVGDSYNGVKHSEKFAFDKYVDVSLGIRFHVMDHYGDHRYYKVRRWEATSLRAEDTKVARMLDYEKMKEIQERENREVVAYGELMQTHILFYTDRTFVNDDQMENIRIVADFLRKHPNVNLVIKGYSGASLKSESPDMHLAENRVNSVKKALLKYYNVDSDRIETWFDEETKPPFPMKGEWIDGVVFQMKKRGL